MIEREESRVEEQASWAALPLMALVQIYRYTLSPLLHWLVPGSGCRFAPSCSAYALEALRTHGALRGTWLGFRRFMRCHPWGGHGFDPVPPADREPACCDRKANTAHRPCGSD